MYLSSKDDSTIHFVNVFWLMWEPIKQLFNNEVSKSNLDLPISSLAGTTADLVNDHYIKDKIVTHYIYALSLNTLLPPIGLPTFSFFFYLILVLPYPNGVIGFLDFRIQYCDEQVYITVGNVNVSTDVFLVQMGREIKRLADIEIFGWIKVSYGRIMKNRSTRYCKHVLQLGKGKVLSKE